MHSIVGGDTIQVVKTAEELNKLGVHAEVFRASDKIDYDRFDLLHFFNIIRPSDHLYHIKKSSKPYVVSTIYLKYSGFDRYGRDKRHRIFFGFLNDSVSEYVKNLFRFYKRQDKLISHEYLCGHKRAIKKILNGASAILPNSASERNRIVRDFEFGGESVVVPNGVDLDLFKTIPEGITREQKVICVAQVFGMKNQHAVIESCKKLGVPVEIVGNPPPNHSGYYNYCKKIADRNATFTSFMPQKELVRHYAASKVHALPSWFETTGLSSLEAAAMGCNLVVSPIGDTRDYFDGHAWFGGPEDQASIDKAIEGALNSPVDLKFRDIVLEKYPWEKAAEVTRSAYKKVLKI
jgi:glycosyltransferase involved in cell wall biosynthesis